MALYVAHNDAMLKWSEILSPFSSAELRDALRVPYQTAAAWKRRNRLPPRHWYAFADFARERGRNISIDDLARADGHTEAA